MKIVFRVDASLKIGIGHVMRCLTLAKELKQRNYEILFICKNLPGNIIARINFPVSILPHYGHSQSNSFYTEWLGSSQEQDSEQTIKVIPQNTDLIIIDNYALDELWHKQLRPYTDKIMVIDDLANRQFDCDILLNQNLGAQINDYKDKTPEGCKLLLGCDYALLRPEFAKLRDKALLKRTKTKKIKNILISMGGIDLANKTFEILQDISDNLNIVVVLGSSSPHNKMIKSYAKNKENVMVFSFISTKNVIPTRVFCQVRVIPMYS